LVFDRTTEQSTRIDSIMMDHLPDPAKGRGQYLSLLELGAREAPLDARASHYLARELRTLGRLPDAAAEFERYLLLRPTTIEERSMSLRLLGMVKLSQGDERAAMDRFRQAAKEAPHLAGGWVDLACALYQRKDWRNCLDACEAAIRTGGGAADYGAVSDSGAIPEDLASVCAWRLGLRGEAVDYARRALEQAPEVQRLKDNLLAMTAALGDGA
jgi:tetratricopeptide (TPR) repeat protein